MKCDYCERTDALTGIDDRLACPDHIDEAMKPLGMTLAAIWEAFDREIGADS